MVISDGDDRDVSFKEKDKHAQDKSHTIGWHYSLVWLNTFTSKIVGQRTNDSLLGARVEIASLLLRRVPYKCWLDDLLGHARRLCRGDLGVNEHPESFLGLARRLGHLVVEWVSGES